MTPTNTPEAARLAEEAKRLARQLSSSAYSQGVADERDSWKQQEKYHKQARDQLAQLSASIDALAALAKQDAAPTSASTVPAESESSGLLKLARYGAAMLHWHRGDNPSECGDVDVITCEEEAVRCGVLEGRNVDEPCCADCICAPFIGWEFCYFMPDDVRAARDKLSAARNPGACSVTDGEAKK